MRHTLAAILAGAVLTGSALLLAQAPRSVEVQLKAAQHKEEVEGDLQGAIALYQALANRARGTERATAAAALLRMAGAYQKLGDAQARAVYQRVIREFADQRDSATAKQLPAALPSPPPALSAPAARALSDSGAIGRGSLPSADGRYVSFTDESGNVALRDIRTGLNRRLTQGGDWWNAWSSGPVVSPDGLEVAYVWYLHPDKAEVRVVSAVEPVSAPRVAFQTGMNETPYKIAWARRQAAARRADVAGSDVPGRHVDNRGSELPQYQVSGMAPSQRSACPRTAGSWPTTCPPAKWDRRATSSCSPPMAARKRRWSSIPPTTRFRCGRRTAPTCCS